MKVPTVEAFRAQASGLRFWEGGMVGQLEGTVPWAYLEEVDECRVSRVLEPVRPVELPRVQPHLG